VLVLQTVLPPLLTAGGRSSITVDGGTHIPFAPPFEFLARTFLPQIERMGPRATARMIRPGFLPVGGGRIVVALDPVEELEPYALLERGEVTRRRATALVSELPTHIGKRELSVVAKRLGWPADDLVVQEVPNARGPGNALVLDLACAHVHEVVFAPGERGVRAETVALRAVSEAFRYLEADVPVGEHLADQLLLPLALGRGGRFRTLPLSSHARTQIDLIRRFLDVEVAVDAIPGTSGCVEVCVQSDAGTRSSAKPSSS
jgi:RNA 3'-terminal phosphate cyclase (ATP)